MSKTSSTDEHVLAEVIDQLKNDTSGDQVSIGDILAAFNDRSFGAVCTVIGVIAVTPVVGAIPGMSIITAMLVLLVAGQYLAGRGTPWTPMFLANRSIAREKVQKAAEDRHGPMPSGWIGSSNIGWSGSSAGNRNGS